MHHIATEMCTFLRQNDGLWDMGLVHCGVCGLLPGKQKMFCYLRQREKLIHTNRTNKTTKRGLVLYKLNHFFVIDSASWYRTNQDFIPTKSKEIIIKSSSQFYQKRCPWDSSSGKKPLIHKCTAKSDNFNSLRPCDNVCVSKLYHHWLRQWFIGVKLLPESMLDLLSIGTLWTNRYGDIWISIPQFTFKKMYFKILSAKSRPFSSGLIELNRLC